MYIKVILFFVVLIAFTVVMWENAYHYTTLQLFGLKIEKLPVLLLVLSSILFGMLIMVPFMWFGKWRTRLKVKKQMAPKPEKIKNTKEPDPAQEQN